MNLAPWSYAPNPSPPPVSRGARGMFPALMRGSVRNDAKTPLHCVVRSTISAYTPTQTRFRLISVALCLYRRCIVELGTSAQLFLMNTLNRTMDGMLLWRPSTIVTWWKLLVNCNAPLPPCSSQFKRGSNESFKNSELRFDAQASKFNLFSGTAKHPEAVTAFMLLANFLIENG